MDMIGNGIVRNKNRRGKHVVAVSIHLKQLPIRKLNKKGVTG